MFKKVMSSLFLGIFFSSLFILNSFVFASNNFQYPLEKSTSIAGTANDEIGFVERIQHISITIGGGEQIRDAIAFITVKVVIPVFVFAGLIMAIVGFYKVMTSDEGEEQSMGFKYILRGTIGIIIMVSAGYIVNQLVGTDGLSGIIGELGQKGANDTVYGAKIAENLYIKIFYPFIKIVIFIILGILFLMAVIHGFKYIFRKDDEFQKKSFTILVYNALGIIVIILAKSIIELVYGKYTDVINSNAANLGQIGTGIIEKPDNFIVLHTAINRILGLATFIVLALIIYQSYQLLVNPSSEDHVEGLKKNIGYTFIGILIIGAGYLLTNFFIIT